MLDMPWRLLRVMLYGFQYVGGVTIGEILRPVWRESCWQVSVAGFEYVCEGADGKDLRMVLNSLVGWLVARC